MSFFTDTLTLLPNFHAGKMIMPVFAGITADAEEQAVIARARKLRKNGVTLQAIADKLNEEGIRTKGRRRAGQLQRGRWFASTVRNILLGSNGVAC